MVDVSTLFRDPQPVQFDFTAWSQPAGFSPILSDTCHPGFMSNIVPVT